MDNKYDISINNMYKLKNILINYNDSKEKEELLIRINNFIKYCNNDRKDIIPKLIPVIQNTSSYIINSDYSGYKKIPDIIIYNNDYNYIYFISDNNIDKNHIAYYISLKDENPDNRIVLPVGDMHYDCYHLDNNNIIKTSFDVNEDFYNKTSTDIGFKYLDYYIKR